MTEHFTREGAEKLALRHSAAYDTITRDYCYTPRHVHNLLNAAGEIAINAKLAEWEAQGAVAKAVVLTTGMGLQWIGEALPAGMALYTRPLPAQSAEAVNAELVEALKSLLYGTKLDKAGNRNDDGLDCGGRNWRPRIKAAEAVLSRLQASQPAEPVNAELVEALDVAFKKITPLPYFVGAGRNDIGVAGNRWTVQGAFSGVTSDSVSRHGGGPKSNAEFLCLLANSWPQIRASLFRAQAAQPVVAVPRITPEMEAAGNAAWMTSDGVDACRVFNAMLTIAPQPQKKEGV